MGVVLTAFIAVLGGIVYQRISGDAANVKALPSSWHPFTTNGNAEIIHKHRLKYCEDVLFDHKQELAILSCDPGRAEWNTVMVSEPHSSVGQEILTALLGYDV